MSNSELALQIGKCLVAEGYIRPHQQSGAVETILAILPASIKPGHYHDDFITRKNTVGKSHHYTENADGSITKD